MRLTKEGEKLSDNIVDMYASKLQVAQGIEIVLTWKTKKLLTGKSKKLPQGETLVLVVHDQDHWFCFVLDELDVRFPFKNITKEKNEANLNKPIQDLDSLRLRHGRPGQVPALHQKVGTIFKEGDHSFSQLQGEEEASPPAR